MNNLRILKKAIKKAEKNGFDWKNFYKYYENSLLFIRDFYKMIIFNHEFCKAFFNSYKDVCYVCGHDYSDCYCNNTVEIEEWQYHLQQMVLEKEPLKYLENFI